MKPRWMESGRVSICNYKQSHFQGGRGFNILFFFFFFFAVEDPQKVPFRYKKKSSSTLLKESSKVIIHQMQVDVLFGNNCRMQFHQKYTCSYFCLFDMFWGEHFLFAYAMHCLHTFVLYCCWLMHVVWGNEEDRIADIIR